MKSFHLIKPYFSENRFSIIIGIICLVIVDLFQLFIPRVVKWAVDDLTSFQIDMFGLFIYAMEIVGLAIAITIFRYVWRRCLIGLSRRVEEGIRDRLFSHLQILSPKYFDKTRTGDLMAHATNDINHIRMATGMGMVALTDALFLGSAAILFMAYINVRLTLYVLIPAPLIIFGTSFFGSRMHRLYGEVQASFSDLTEVVRERFTGIRIIKAYNREAESTERLERMSEEYIGKNIRLVTITGSFFPMMVFLSNLSMAIVIFIGGRQTILAEITPGDFVAFISYLSILTWPMMALGWLTNLIQRGKASLDRIDTILKTEPAIADPPDPQPMREYQDRIVLEKVSFSYGETDEPADRGEALSDIDLTLEKGKTLGIIGPPGGGKTTLLQLIPRLYDVNTGSIRIDGKDIRNVRVADLRSLISFVPQEPFLFAGTIRENITFNDPGITEEQLIKAAREAALLETIEGFAKGFETIVGEKGVILSGGQKQRIGLARALLRDASILMLDDPISQVDTETGNTIIETIRKTAARRTILIVSHRLSALKAADEIIVLKNGRITQSGTHETLMERDGYYARTYRLQEMEEALNV